VSLSQTEKVPAPAVLDGVVVSDSRQGCYYGLRRSMSWLQWLRSTIWPSSA
jgi:hypothetical protein